MSDKLTEILGYDPTKNPSPTAAILAEVANELRKEREDKARGRAKELLTKAVELRTQKADLDKKYQQAAQKFDKEFGKLMKQIDALAQGQEPAEEVEVPVGQTADATV